MKEEWFASYKEFKCQFCRCLLEYLEKCAKIVYVLLDFCQLQKVEKSVFEVLMGIATLCNEKLCTVIALSSGEGHDLDMKLDYRTPISMLVGARFIVKGFTEKEMRKYVEVNNCPDDFDVVKEHCGSNPLLLHLWIIYKKDELLERIQIVKETVDRYLKYNLKFGEDDFAPLHVEKFYVSIFFLPRSLFSFIISYTEN